jgi:NADH pyrophosphatase NudC (nudix superfamily)
MSERRTERIETAYCASCGETKAVWTGPKQRECIDCGQTVYDDHETFETAD